MLRVWVRVATDRRPEKVFCNVSSMWLTLEGLSSAGHRGRALVIKGSVRAVRAAALTDQSEQLI